MKRYSLFSLAYYMRIRWKQLTNKEKKMENRIFEHYTPKDRSNLIALLQDVQEAYGYLPEGQLKAIAEYVGIPLSTVYGVATFYTQFRLKPIGKYLILQCNYLPKKTFVDILLDNGFNKSNVRLDYSNPSKIDTLGKLIITII